MIKVGIYGGTGYMGGEVLRVIMDHPQAEVLWVTGRSGGDIAFYHPNLYGMSVKLVHPSDISPCDVVFLALPTTAPFLHFPPLPCEQKTHFFHLHLQEEFLLPLRYALFL